MSDDFQSNSSLFRSSIGLRNDLQLPPHLLHYLSTPFMNSTGEDWKLWCLVEGYEEPIGIHIQPSRDVDELKTTIKVMQEIPGPTSNFIIWKLNESIQLPLLKNPLSGGQRVSDFATKLDPSEELSDVFPQKPANKELYIVVTIEGSVLKRKRDDPTDVSQELFNLWKKPAKCDLHHLKEYLEKPLDPDWKIPLPHDQWKALLVPESIPAHACSAKDLELLFRQSEDETAVAMQNLLTHTISVYPGNPSGTENSLISFWDANIREVLERCTGVPCIRDSNQGTETGKFRPDFGLLLANVCVFRGEEKRIDFTGTHPRDELISKTRWVYNPAPYILGYYAIGVEVTLTAILPPGAQGESTRVVDIISVDLSSRRERIKNASRMIKLCGILIWLQQVIGEGKDRDMRVQIRDGGKSIEYFSLHVRKTYGLAEKEDGEERVKHLQAIYESLISKGVPNVDRIKKAEIQHYVHGSYVDLEPKGIDEGPKSPSDVRNAVVCVLEALKVAHADPPMFHRDIRWPNIMQSREDSSKWFLIDWEDASFAPTKGAPHLSQNEHSPNVFKDNHGADVDLWGVGRLIFTTRVQVPTLRNLGQMLMEGRILNAEQGLKEIYNLSPF